MRIILFPATVAAAAMAAAAPAQTAPNGHVRYPVSIRTAAQGGHVPGGRVSRPGRGMDQGRRHGRHGRGFGRGGEGFPYPFAAYGIEGDHEAVDPHGTGFFAGAGGRIRLEGGRPYYEYDRAYPYEWASAAGGGRPHRAREEAGWSVLSPRCALEKGVRVCRGEW